MPTTVGHPLEGAIEIDAILVKSITLPESIPSIADAYETAIVNECPSTTLDYLLTWWWTTHAKQGSECRGCEWHKLMDLAEFGRQNLLVQTELMTVLSKTRHRPDVSNHHSVFGPCLAWGNSGGLSLLEKIDRHDAEFHSIKNSLETTQKRMTDLEFEVSSMKGEIVTLKQESDAYLTIWNRFFATFQRDLLKSVLEKDKATIPEGNNSAHGGDFLADAKLYEKHHRFEDNVFTQLYGLAWQRAESYREQPEVVSALNLYTSAVADPLYTIHDLSHLKECFAKFIVSLQTGGYRRFITLSNSSEKHALDAFLKAHRTLPNKFKDGLV